jgi:hypothetical protein
LSGVGGCSPDRSPVPRSIHGHGKVGVQVVTALVILAVCGVAGLVLWWRRRRAERARQDRHDEDHYGRHALDLGRMATGDIPAQRQRPADMTDTMHLLSGDAFVPMAGPAGSDPHHTVRHAG